MSYDIDLATYEIKIKKLSEKVINDYINKYKPLNSSAAFRYEVAKDILVDSFIDKENDISGLIGLPLIKLKKMLEKNNIITD
jgi:predicted house-cleaning NTP pyrophosphatase (Maf/HAM1 superfamily)